jgi:hypothetical protein
VKARHGVWLLCAGRFSQLYVYMLGSVGLVLTGRSMCLGRLSCLSSRFRFWCGHLGSSQVGLGHEISIALVVCELSYLL